MIGIRLAFYKRELSVFTSLLEMALGFGIVTVQKLIQCLINDSSIPDDVINCHFANAAICKVRYCTTFYKRELSVFASLLEMALGFGIVLDQKLIHLPDK